jgi:predicted metal-binding transcription factor (methanogenesis marker protein 9)
MFYYNYGRIIQNIMDARAPIHGQPSSYTEKIQHVLRKMILDDRDMKLFYFLMKCTDIVKPCYLKLDRTKEKLHHIEEFKIWRVKYLQKKLSGFAEP